LVSNSVKVRIGIGLGTMTGAGTADRFTTVVDRCEALGFDSLWMSERIGAPAPDPMIALAVAAGRTSRMKLGTSVLVLPGRNPVILAKEMATLDVLSDGRFLPAVGLGAVDPPEQRAFGVERTERGRRHDEALALMRRCWTGEVISHHGEFYAVDDVQVLPRPHQDSLDVWLGGIAPSELRRVGRVGDGWLPSFCTPADVAEGLPVIERAAADAGRSVDPQHYGALVSYSDGPVPPRFAELLERRRPGVDPRSVIPTRADLPRLLREFVDAGASKFVVVPLVGDADPDRELGLLAHDLLPLET
jgi:probable F420-dependent oxidoreductase